MGSAIAHALGECFLCDPKAPADFTDVSEMLPLVDVLILAIKPQHFQPIPASEKLIISVMAGVTIEAIQKKTGTTRIIRSMPNLGVSLRKGVIGWFASPSVSEAEKKWAREAFHQMGVEVEVEREEMLNAVTAVSGSGPAYFFYLAEQLTLAAQTLGFSKEQARLLSEGALITSGQLLSEGDQSATEWCQRVTSAGGTTEAALTHLRKSTFEQTFIEAVDAANQRAKELDED